MWYLFFKRGVDLILSLLMVLVFFPLMILISIMIGLESGFDNVIFLQKRLGQKGKVFRIIKFKTLKSSFLKKDYIGHNNSEETRIGSFLRKYSLDEIPQLFNVLSGNMSWVGPRPLPVEYGDYILSNYRQRLNVKPGLVCLTHLNGRNLLNWKQKFQLDLEYIESANLRKDFFILSRIPTIISKGEGSIISPNLLNQQ